MMTQSDLVKLAKQGNPQAIAALMNLALESKGVTAKAAVKEDCLHICFSSEQLLSQKTLMGFVQAGLTALGALSFQRVKVYAQKLGQEIPVWSEILLLGNGGPSLATSGPQSNGPSIGSGMNQGTAAELDLPSFRTAIAEPLPTPAVSPPIAEVPTLTAAPPANVSIPPTPRPRPRPKPGTKRQPGWRRTARQLAQKFPLSNKYVLGSAIAGSAFLFGGIIALVTTALTGGGQNGQNYSNAVASSNQLTQAGSTNQLNEITAYLAKMNKAQQAFHQTNGRFATNLEELEQSASIISRSSKYDFKLVLRDQTQALVTALPKSKDAYSYAGAVMMNQSNPSAATASAIVCASNQPSIFPPVIPQPTAGKFQCPGDSSPVLN